MPRIRSRLTTSLALLAVLGLFAAAFAARTPVVCTPRPAELTAVLDIPGPPPPSATTGQLLVANQGSGTASIVDLATGAVTHLPAGEEPHDTAVSPDGRWGVVSDYGRESNGNKLVVIDMAAKSVARVIDLGKHRGAHGIEFLPGSSTRVVVTTQVSRDVVEVDLEKGTVLAAIETRGEGSHALALARDGRTLFTSNEESGSLSRLDLAKRAFVRHYPVGPRPEGIAITPDGREVWTASRESGQVRVIDVEKGTVLAAMPGVGTPDNIAMSRDGRRAAIPDFRCGVLHVADVPGRRMIGAITGLARPHMVAFAPDSRVAFVTLGDEKVAAVIDLDARRVLARYPVGDRPDGVAWGPTVRGSTR